MCENCTFLADGTLIKQFDRCPLGGPVSAVFPSIFCVKLELDVIKQLRPKIYKCSADDNIW